MNRLIFYYIDNFNKSEIQKLDRSISIIYRNYYRSMKKKDIMDLIKLCKNHGRKVYFSNNLKIALKYNFNGLYIPSFNKHLKYKNIQKKNFEIIGSAHNVIEIKIKEKQGCCKIFLSPVFKTKKNRNCLGSIKIKLLKNFTTKKVICLGGIDEKSLKKIHHLRAQGFASISWIKKNGPSINTGPFYKLKS